MKLSKDKAAKAKSVGKKRSAAASAKLKSKRKAKVGLRQKKKALSRKKTVRAKRKASSPPSARRKAKGPATRQEGNKAKIVRIMGQGQFTVGNRTLKRLNEVDNSIVDLVSTERSDDMEFKKRLAELSDIVMKDGKPLDPKEIIRSDIILPSTDLSIDEAKKLFRGEGVVPEII